jgi:hypothetical protein
VKEIHTHLNL